MLAGLIIVAAASQIGEPDLIWLGLFLIVLPLLSLLVVIGLQPRLRYTRELHPAQVAVGDDLSVVLRLRNLSGVAATTLEMYDQAPAELGGGGEFIVARAFGRWEQAVRYPLRTQQRGRYLIGPLKARAGDPLGLAVAAFSVKGEYSVVRVTPKVWPLAQVTRGLGIGASGEAAKQRTGHTGQDDVLVREHRHGDDIRRIHWRMTAKQGELMVRLEEHPWDPSALIVVDIRTRAHLGIGPTSSLEWSISAAASLGAHLTDDRYRIIMVAGTGAIMHPFHSRGGAQRQAIIESLADTAPSPALDLASVVNESESLDATGTLAFFGGLLWVDDAAALVALGQHMARPCALVADAAAWGTHSLEHDDAVRLLRRSGWVVEHYGPGASVPQTWSALMVRQSAS